MKKKLTLEQLKVSSFTTDFKKDRANTVKGGATYTCDTYWYKCSLVLCPTEYLCAHTDQAGCEKPKN